MLDILRTAEDFEKCSQNGNRVRYLPLESIISNRSIIAYLKTKVDMLFFTIKHCQNVRDHGAGVNMGKCMRMMFFFFFRFDPALFPLLSLSFPTFPFAFSCAFRMLGHLNLA